MAILIIGLALFLGIHSISIATPGFRDRAMASMGSNPWRGLYSLVSAAGFVLILYGYHLARQSPEVLYVSPAWLWNITLILMAPVFPLLFAAYMPGRIKTVTKHPMLIAVMLWGFAHLLSSGLLADVLLFGSFLVWAVLDRLSFARRPPQVIRTAPPGRFNDSIAVAAGLALYAVLILWGHAWLFGVSPLG